jgi:hypothetical protein
MNIKDLSITDLKASLDFTREFLNDMKKKAKEEKINADDIPAYRDYNILEDRLYNALINKVSILK